MSQDPIIADTKNLKRKARRVADIPRPAAGAKRMIITIRHKELQDDRVKIHRDDNIANSSLCTI
jgi:hypothetical protein